MASPEEQLVDFGRDIREMLSFQSRGSEPLRIGRRCLLEEIASRNEAMAQASRSRASRLRLGWGLAALGVASAAAVVLVLLRSPLSFRIGPSMAGRTGDVIEAKLDAPLPLRFSEGSSLLLHQGTRVRVLSTGADGARVLVESGTLEATIAHRRARQTRWQFELGPFHVLVTGTRFRATWSPSRDTLSLATQQGSVVVSGRCIDGLRTVAAGQQLDLSCPASPAAASPTAIEPPTGESPAVDSTRPSGDAKRGARESPWRNLLARRQLSQALRAAEDTGFQQVCDEASPKELFALSDAARLAGRLPLATEALHALRVRFPRTADASNAAFALGRMAFEMRDACDEAVLWFSIYLDEQPGGALMGDATGRLMESRRCAGDRRGARAEAQRYLHRFPRGPYARQARSILADS